MPAGHERGSGAFATTAAVATLVLFAGALAVRSLRGEAPLAPADRPRAADALREPLQLLGRSAALRIEELTPRISPAHEQAWKAARKLPFELRDCPTTGAWLDTADGQRFERLLGDLRRGSRDEALAALALMFELARTSEWDPGLLARTQHAERIGALLADWLRSWGERGAVDTMLAEPTLAAVLVYGLAMHVAADPLPIGRNQAAYGRAQALLETLLVDAHGQPTALSRGLRARHPVALDGFASKRDCLKGFAREAQQLFPGLDGECGE